MAAKKTATKKAPSKPKPPPPCEHPDDARAMRQATPGTANFRQPYCADCGVNLPR